MKQFSTLFALFSPFFINAQHSCAWGNIEHIQVNNTSVLPHNFASQPRNGNLLYKIPVVCHVVWRDSVENLSDSIILANFEQLNANFMQLDPDSNLIRPEFLAVRGCASIEFEVLAINHIQTDSIFIQWGSKPYWDAVKYPALGGVAPVEPEKYMNVWFCDFKRSTPSGLISQTGGAYARPPLGLPLWANEASLVNQLLDGIVIDDNTFLIPTLEDVFTHETGHYLGLKHTFSLGFGVDCDINADGMTDTPAASAFNQNCNEERNSCEENEPGDLPDMWENYMDYAHECSSMFTAEQVAYMQNVLVNYRPQLYTSISSAVALPSLAGGVTISPNPATTAIHVNLSFDAIEAALYDENGTRVYAIEQPQSGLHIMQTDRLPGGFYLLRVSAPASVQYVKVLIVR